VISESVKTRRFLVVDVFQLLLVDPSQKQMGWGIVKFVGFLQVRENITFPSTNLAFPSHSP